MQDSWWRKHQKLLELDGNMIYWFQELGQQASNEAFIYVLDISKNASA